jgi:hypothetical protein
MKTIPNLLSWKWTYTYDFVAGVVLSQLEKYNLFHLVNFHSLKFFFTKINYNIHDKELIIIMDAFEE